jgi:hypothetical protein
LDELKAGRRPKFLLSRPRQSVEIAALDDNGGMRLASQGLDMPYKWDSLTTEDHQRLALSFVREDSPPAQALAAFFCLASGGEEQGRKILDGIADAKLKKDVLDGFVQPEAGEKK